jgi:hypothetical protein
LDIDPREIRQRFSELSDDALLAVERDQLTEIGQEIYDDELDERGLLTEPAEEDETAPAPDPNFTQEQQVHVATFLDYNDAQMAVNLLRGAEIPVNLESEIGAAFSGVGALRLMVPASLVEQAEEILDTEISDEELAAQAEAAGEPGEPSDDETEL